MPWHNFSNGGRSTNQGSQTNRIIALYLRGYTPKRIATETRRTPSTVYRVLRDYERSVRHMQSYWEHWPKSGKMPFIDARETAAALTEIYSQ
jgi:hypothetical protein